MTENTDNNNTTTTTTTTTPIVQTPVETPKPLPTVKQPIGQLREDTNRGETRQVDTPKHTDK